MNYVCGLAWLIRVMWLIRCTGIPRINHEAPIRHDKRRGPPRRWYGWDGRDAVRPKEVAVYLAEAREFGRRAGRCPLRCHASTVTRARFSAGHARASTTPPRASRPQR